MNVLSRILRLWARLPALYLALCLFSSPSAVLAQTATPATPTDQTTEQKVDQLLNLMGQDDVRTLLAQRLSDTSDIAAPDESNISALDQWASKRREHLARLAGDAPAISGELSKAGGTLVNEIETYGALRFLSHVALLFGVGIAAGIATYRITAARAARALPGNVAEFALATASRRLLPAMGYGLSAMIMFFTIPWSPLLSAVLLPWLVVSIGLPLVKAVVDLLKRVINDGQNSRRKFWLSRSFDLLTFTVVCWAVLRTLASLGAMAAVVKLISYAMIAALFALGVYFVWRQPQADANTERRRSLDVALTFYLFILFALWIAGTGVFFWLGFFALVLPGAVGTLGIAARKTATAIGGYSETDFRPVLAQRSVRLLVLGAAVIWLLFLIRNHPGALPGGSTVSAMFTGLLHGILVLLFADLFWVAIKTVIARRLEMNAPATGEHGVSASDDRLQTILPILRNMLGIVIGAVSVMTVLSELGVNIGPLLASAGIFGIAIGFGSQTLVKDIISGVFYMIDDAFRVGEYIQSGSYKGTVESFSIRSVKLRHHRGPIYTVPFGSLGAVENMSRDWSIDKFLVTVAFDTDLAKVKSITREIGRELKEDPEFGPLLIETVKLKGVEQFGEYGMTLGFGMMVKPSGQQSVIRRKAYSMLKDAFEKNGIEFATMNGTSPGKAKSGSQPPEEPPPEMTESFRP
ncbi:mechanosensitive ion channel family protein [Agrobacterium sp. NPDC058088]|uniref:mechanosensitive ion channel family protein n=1 Tax=Agrobacterium sp. NPDC058088 TaxID=3346335 RepID=UPI0036DF877D